VNGAADGELTKTRVIVGESKEKIASDVPTWAPTIAFTVNPASDPLSPGRPAPLGLQMTEDMDVHTAVAHDVSPMMTVGVDPKIPKFAPMTVRVLAPVSGIFDANELSTTGESKLNFTPAVPTVFDSATLTDLSPPIPAMLEHTMLVMLSHTEVPQVSLPTITVIARREETPKFVPTNVTSAPPTTSALSGAMFEMTGASKLKTFNIVPINGFTSTVACKFAPAPLKGTNERAVFDIHVGNNGYPTSDTLAYADPSNTPKFVPKRVMGEPTEVGMLVFRPSVTTGASYVKSPIAVPKKSPLSSTMPAFTFNLESNTSEPYPLGVRHLMDVVETNTASMQAVLPILAFKLDVTPMENPS